MSADKVKMLALLEQASDSLDKAMQVIRQQNVMIMKAKLERNRALNNYLMLRCVHEQIQGQKDHRR